MSTCNYLVKLAYLQPLGLGIIPPNGYGVSNVSETKSPFWQRWFGNKETKTTALPEASDTVGAEEIVSQPSPKEENSLWERLKGGLSKTRKRFSDGLANVFLGKKEIDDQIFDALELALLQADVGVKVTQAILKELTFNAARGELTDTKSLKTRLIQLLTERLYSVEIPLELKPSENKLPRVILTVGVNGAGKTTTIGKLAHQLKEKGQSVLLAAGDTFRAAAIEQLQVWGERNQIPVIAQKPGSDSASVIFDALSAAKAREIDVVIADTAGRLHTQNDLMRELEKVTRVIKKFDASAPHEVLLVLDGSTGQNALLQAAAFSESVGVTGIAITKLDGTAKGGAVFAIAEQLQKPIRFIGVGEGIHDLQVFSAKAFVEAMIG